MLYEDQAEGFDERAAIPAEAVESMAAAVVEIAGLRQGGTLLEIGPGTGMLSLPLIRRPIRYIGFDRSPAMLAVFHEKVEEARLRAELLAADGNGRWPVEDGSVAAIFSALEAVGGERTQPRVVARWTRRHAPLDSIAAWQGKEGLAGYDIPKKVKERVLGRLRVWAEERYGNLEAPLQQEEFFELDAINVRAEHNHRIN